MKKKRNRMSGKVFGLLTMGVFLSALVVTMVGAAAEAVDILQEGLEKDGNWLRWAGSSFVIDTSTSKLGESSMKITGKGSVHRYLLAKGDTEYEISFWYKTKGLSGKNPLRIGLNSYDLDTLWLLHRQYDMPGAEKNTDWTQYVEKLVVPFKRTWLEFGFWMPGGEVWIDGLQFRELGKSSLHSSGMIR